MPSTRYKTRLFLTLFVLAPVISCDRQESAPLPERAVVQETAQPARSPQENYQTYCAQCHEGGVPRAPHSIVFQMMGTEALRRSMVDGVMALQAEAMSDTEIAELAQHLGGASAEAGAARPVEHCGPEIMPSDVASVTSMADWGITPQNTRFIPAELAGLQASEVPRLKLKWVFAYPGATRARSQPVVAGNTVIAGSQDGTVYALDLDSGCTRWAFRADAEVRSAVTVEPAREGGTEPAPRVYLGDFTGNVYALDARDGSQIWKSNLDDHHNVTITGSPKLHGDVLYVPMSSTEWASAADPAYECCTFRGGVAAFSRVDGRLLWKSYTILEEPRPTGRKNSQGAATWAPAGAPVWGSLTIDEKRNVLYAPTGQGYTSPAVNTSDSIIAFNLDSGRIEWVFQATQGDAWNMSCFIGEAANCPEEDGPDFDFGAPPVLLTLSNGRDILLAGQKSGFVYALDPDRQGELIWKKRIGLGGFLGGVHWGMAAHDDILYAPNADTNLINKWQGERTPGLYALKAESGAQVWFTPAVDVCPENSKPACDRGLSAAITAIPGVVFAGALDGHLRAYDISSGAVIWDFNTADEFSTLSGETARGGSIEADGPVVAGGTVLVNSGYLFGGRMGGNVLLAFTVDGK